MIVQAATTAGTALVKYAPAVYDGAMNLVGKATNGKVKSASDIVNFVKGDASKMSVVAGALAMGGIAVDDIVPRDLAGRNEQLAKIRQTSEGIAVQMRGQFDAGSDKLVAASEEDTARDLLRKQRVNAVLNVYGSAEQYFLCHPNGGVPRADFAWFKTMGFRRNGV